MKPQISPENIRNGLLCLFILAVIVLAVLLTAGGAP